MLVAGENAGTLSEEGAKLLDTTGKLSAGIPLCPPEGDAGTGMTATNSITNVQETFQPVRPYLLWLYLKNRFQRLIPKLI